jgi:hypothetical protein
MGQILVSHVHRWSLCSGLTSGKYLEATIIVECKVIMERLIVEAMMMFPCQECWDERLPLLLPLQASSFPLVALDHDALSQFPSIRPRPAHRITVQASFAPPRIQPPILLAQPDNAPTDIIATLHAPPYSFNHGARVQTSSCEPRTGGG